MQILQRPCGEKIMTDKHRLNNSLAFMYRLKAYVSLGYGSWIGFLVSIATFVMVLYGYLGTNFLFDLGNPIIFLSWAFPLVLVVCGFVGYWAYYRGAEAVRLSLAWKQNPAYWDLYNLIKGLDDTVSSLEKRLDLLLGELHDRTNELCSCNKK